MMDTIKKLYEKYKDLIKYGIFGVLTTVVNYLVYYAAKHGLMAAGLTEASVIPLGTVSNVIAWFVSVLFAFFTNCKFVFDAVPKTAKEFFRQMVLFFAARLFSGFLDTAIVWVFVDNMHFNDFWVKLVSNVIVIILNYFFSKFVIFVKKKPQEIAEKTPDTGEHGSEKDEKGV